MKIPNIVLDSELLAQKRVQYCEIPEEVKNKENESTVN